MKTFVLSFFEWPFLTGFTVILLIKIWASAAVNLTFLHRVWMGGLVFTIHQKN